VGKHRLWPAFVYRLLLVNGRDGGVAAAMTQEYLNMLEHVLAEGVCTENRTGVDTYSVFGYQTRYNLQEGFPLLTTKKMFTKGIIHELLWFLSGDTNVKYLQDNGVTIWDEWATEEQCKKFNRPKGELGPIYGHQWRNFGAQSLWTYSDDGKTGYERFDLDSPWLDDVCC